MDVVPYAQSKRSGRRGAVVGAAVGLLPFGYALTLPDNSLRLAAGGLLMCLSGGGMLGALLAVRLYSYGRHGQLPESRRCYLGLLCAISVLGFAGILGGALLGGVTGDNG